VVILSPSMNMLGHYYLKLGHDSFFPQKLFRYRHAGAKGERMNSSTFLTSALNEDEWCHIPAALCSKEWIPGTHWIQGWVDLRAGLDTEARGKILCMCRGSNPDRPVCSQTLYTLSCFRSACFHFHIRSNLLCINHQIIRRYVV
jgi:hypothetical protein